MMQYKGEVIDNLTTSNVCVGVVFRVGAVSYDDGARLLGFSDMTALVVYSASAKYNG